MKRILLILIVSGLFSCKGNRDEDYVRGFRQIKQFSKTYTDSINTLSKQPVR